ncbi:acylphosphatase [Candidatus Curtissbacteria bacterium]|nr:acylphosphatase [Candidatus Curtissbacteria bacterium]
MTVQLLISGKVQGVFYRKSAKIEAERLGIVGWIKNLDDGLVEVSVEGEKGRLEQFVAWCKKGPPLANVEKVEEQWSDSSGNWKEFAILD